jgi:hypothetical protein
VVNFTFPAAGQRGAETEVLFRGNNLSDTRTVLFDEPGFEVTKVSADKGKFVAKVKVPPTASLGEHRFRVITESGAADLRVFYVTPFPLVGNSLAEEAKNKTTEKTPKLIPLNTTVFGRTPGENEEHYAVECKKGERLSIDVVAMQLATQAPYDPEVSIYKPDGSLLQTIGSTPFGRGAPVFSCTVPEDGTYRIAIHDASRSGQGMAQYLMHVGSFARPVAALPMGAAPGIDTSFQLLGDPKGPLTQTAKLSGPNASFAFLQPAGDPPVPNPLPVRVSELPNVLETAKAATPAEAAGPAAPLPAAFNGRIEQAGEKDFFRFSAKKGEVWDFRVFARSLRSALDSVLELYDAKGNRLALNDDSAGADSYFRWTSPRDDEFVLGIRDQLGRGGSTYSYRIEASKPVPKVKIALPEMTQNNSQDRRAIVIPQGNRFASLVRVKREDWAGGVQIQTPDLPPDIVASAAPIEKAFDTVAMVFESSTASPKESRLVEFTATSLEAPEAPKPLVDVEHKVDIHENGNRRPFYSVLERKLPVVVTAPIPVRIDTELSRATIVRSGQISIKVKVTRSGDFKGPVELVLLHTPAGLGTAGGTKIPADATEGSLTISANTDAPLRIWKTCIAGYADFGEGNVWFSTGLFELEVIEAPFNGTLVRTSLAQNGTAQMKCKIEPKGGFEGKAKIELLGLPLGVTAKPVEISPEDTLATFELQAAATSPIGLNKQVVVQCTTFKEGTPLVSTCARNGVLRIDRAENPAPPPAPAAPPAPQASTPAAAPTPASQAAPSNPAVASSTPSPTSAPNAKGPASNP